MERGERDADSGIYSPPTPRHYRRAYDRAYENREEEIHQQKDTDRVISKLSEQSRDDFDIHSQDNNHRTNKDNLLSASKYIAISTLSRFIKIPIIGSFIQLILFGVAVGFIATNQNSLAALLDYNNVFVLLSLLHIGLIVHFVSLSEEKPFRIRLIRNIASIAILYAVVLFITQFAFRALFLFLPLKEQPSIYLNTQAIAISSAVIGLLTLFVLPSEASSDKNE